MLSEQGTTSSWSAQGQSVTLRGSCLHTRVTIRLDLYPLTAETIGRPRRAERVVMQQQSPALAARVAV